MILAALDDILDRLRDRCIDVAERYRPGGYIDGGLYHCLSPLRADRHIGSFVVNLRGPHQGRFHDFKTGDNGDMLDLIQHTLGCDCKGAMAEARLFLGMADLTVEQKRLRERELAAAKAQRQQDEVEAEANQRQKRRDAQGLWLACSERLDGTPVAAYLAGRGIGLDRLSLTPRAIRYHPGLKYFHTDRETGEIIEGIYPAMVTAINGPAQAAGGPTEFYGAHRTYLLQRPDGSWGKAPVPAAKKVLGTLKGGYIRLCSAIGPRGGRMTLARAGEGARAYITEGIEDGLSVAVFKGSSPAQPYFVLCGVSLGNIAAMQLPEKIREVTIVADNDTLPDQLRLIDKAVARFRSEGRSVDVWRNAYGGKDLNDALVAALEQEGVA